MRKFLLLVMVLLIYVYAYADREQSFTVGVRAFNGVQSSYQKWTPTLKYLESRQSKYSFNLMPVFGFDQMRTLVENKEIDFVITQPAEAVILSEKYNTEIILTLLNQDAGKPLAYFSSVVFTRADNKGINSFKDIKGKTFAAIDPEGLGAYWMGLREIRDAGLRENKDFNVVFVGTQDRIVDYVMEGRADAGTVRSGILEDMANKKRIDLKDVKVLNRVYDGLPQLHSTRLYPEWAFSAREGMSKDVSLALQDILTSIPKDHSVLKESKYAGWIMPVSYISIYDLMKDLDVGLYAEQSIFSLKDVPFYLKILLPLAAAWIVILFFVVRSIYRK